MSISPPRDCTWRIFDGRSEIISWANTKLALGQKDISIKHFQDQVRPKLLVQNV